MPPDPNEPLPLVPPALADDLRVLSAAPPVPDRVDRLVLLHAERQFAEHARSRRTRFRVQRLAAAAAAVAIFTLAGTLISRRMAVRPPQPRIAADVDGNGVVNILDALALARQLDGPNPPALSWDLNADGRVDAVDAHAIAMRAVRLGGAG